METTGTILVVDDERTTRMVMKVQLTRAGFNVILASDGASALAILENREVDLVLLDVIMPGMDGNKVLQKIKADPMLRHIPVVMISSLDERSMVIGCIEIGADDYLEKPVDHILLRARIGNCLARKRWHDQAQAYLREIERERAKSERLLLNVLPESIAERLKKGEQLIADSFESTTVLFADLVGFTSLSSNISPHDLLLSLNTIFSKFDELVARYGLEKIKTIGDAYMVVGGVPDARADHADAVAMLALDMVKVARSATAVNGAPLRVRIGISSGPVVAGIVGRQKFIYDLWGNTVNVASRMESMSQPNKIQISAATRALFTADFDYHSRGRLDVKGKGIMETYWLAGRSPIKV